MQYIAIIFGILGTSAILAHGSSDGLKTWIEDNSNEFVNLTVPWTTIVGSHKSIPDWLKGTHIKNGPAKTTFGGERHYHNLADGWAKLHKFNIYPDGLQYTGKFLRTPIYNKCMEAKEIVPSFTMGPITPDFSVTDLPEIASNAGDNTMVTVVRVGDEFIATTDLPKVNIFDVHSLDFVEFFDPGLSSSTGPSTMSSAHWRKEPGTNNLLNFHIMGIPGVWETLHLFRYPDGDLHNPQEIGNFHITKSTMIHMFSVTEHFAIFFVYPIHVDSGCVVTHLLHNLLECVVWEGEKPDSTDVYVMSLKDGTVVSQTKAKGIYSTHHINAFEDPDEPKLIVDVVEAPWFGLKNLTDKDVMSSHEDNGRMTNDFAIERVTINLSENTIEFESWENEANIPYVNQFDFPMINPEYEGKQYRYAYGQAIVEFERQYLIKKDLVDSSQDKVWFKENHYNGEPMFIPRPGSEQEDDGVLLVTVLNGETKQSYLLMLDGETFEPIAEALLPERIPMSIHGYWSPDIL